jgi:hypothetical protein
MCETVAATVAVAMHPIIELAIQLCPHSRTCTNGLRTSIGNLIMRMISCISPPSVLAKFQVRLQLQLMNVTQILSNRCDSTKH